ncbi:glycosyltransferase [Patescibacteria group bacterium]|nr:glycosyltransferase [Patescibacteria group bacterium]
MEHKRIVKIIKAFSPVPLLLSTAIFLFRHPLVLNYRDLIPIVVVIFSFFLSVYGILTLTWMLYAWEDPDYIDQHKAPKKFLPARLSFTALVPARREEKVIADTIRSINNINYPENLKEILVILREDDEKTISKVKSVIEELNNKNIRLVVFNDFPINKPHALNLGLNTSKNEIIAIFDAEDEPHPDIYHIVNTVMLKERADIIQSGVQLINYRSHWFSAFNCMEYFFWFKSGLNFFARVGQVIPLGGNTVFIKTPLLKDVGGWDDSCLTEDADIGIRLVQNGAKIKVVYDEQYVTKEETPHSIKEFIKQRTRWNQGFLQVLIKNDWLRLPKLRQKIVAGYILLSPGLQAILLLYTVLGVWIILNQKVSLLLALFSFLPLFLFVLQAVTIIIGLHKFTKEYRLKFPLWMPFKIILVFYPYQLLHAFSSFRALYRIIRNQNGWEKTHHANEHRKILSSLAFDEVNAA